MLHRCLYRSRRYGHATDLEAHAIDSAWGGWRDGDVDVLADDVVVGRIMKVAASRVGSPWMWTLVSARSNADT
jgi:hypothetical protein